MRENQIIPKQDPSGGAYVDYQLAVKDFQNRPNEENRLRALKKHQKWQALFLDTKGRRSL